MAWYTLRSKAIGQSTICTTSRSSSDVWSSTSEQGKQIGDKLRQADASKQGKICITTGVTPSTKPDNQDEDCLYLSVYAPSNSDQDTKLPVFVYIQGGGFNSNSNPNLNGTGLIKTQPMVTVFFNYRVGPFGFLASSSTGKGLPTTNNGLRDQRKVFEWVQKNIAQFGGDPGKVTIGGASAGAASVSLHLTAFGGRNDNLFHAAAGESVSFATMNTPSEAQYQYDHYTDIVGCKNNDVAKSLACLRGKSTNDLLVANINIPYAGQSKAPLYMFSPIVDGDIITDLTYNLLARGKFINVPVIFGADTNDGRSFVPKSTSDQAAGNAFLTQQWPSLTASQLTSLNNLYPVPSGCSGAVCAYQRTSAIYGDMRYACPGLYMNSAYSNATVHGKRAESEVLFSFVGGGSLRARSAAWASTAPSWAYRYNVEDPKQIADGLGVPHTAEVSAIFGPDNVSGTSPASYAAGQINAKSVNVVQSYWASFIRYHDPNVGRYAGSSPWSSYSSNPNGQPWRMLFDTAGQTSMETISQDQQKKCAYAQSIGPSIKQ